MCKLNHHFNREARPKEKDENLLWMFLFFLLLGNHQRLIAEPERSCRPHYTLRIA